MDSVTEDEARELLRQPLILEGGCDFVPTKQRHWHHEIERGLMRAADGVRSGLIVKLEYVITRDTHLRTFQFGVFQTQLGGLRRVYQLTVTNSKRKIKDLHRLSHEHMGQSRSDPQPDWERWTFEQALAYFCQQTNITIDPPIDNPEELKLK